MNQLKVKHCYQKFAYLEIIVGSGLCLYQVRQRIPYWKCSKFTGNAKRFDGNTLINL